MSIQGAGGQPRGCYPLGHYDKTNYLRTNAICQFIRRNYSVNNQKTIVACNSEGLPIGFGEGIPAAKPYTGFFHGLKSSEIRYDCRLSAHHQ